MDGRRGQGFAQACTDLRDHSSLQSQANCIKSFFVCLFFVNIYLFIWPHWVLVTACQLLAAACGI